MQLLTIVMDVPPGKVVAAGGRWNNTVHRLSIIIPVLNESPNINAFLSAIPRNKNLEIIVVDGGSSDNTVDLARQHSLQVITAGKGRALQMNAGAKHATGDVFLFLHADTYLPKNFLELIETALNSSNNCWGRFDVRLSGASTAFRIIEFMINLRSRFSGIATGDQALFVKREVFEKIGGYPPIPIMEDVALSARLKKLGRPVCLQQKVKTSSRRWEKNGILKTVFLMWKLRLAFYLGVAPEILARKYS